MKEEIMIGARNEGTEGAMDDSWDVENILRSEVRVDGVWLLIK